MRLVIEVLKAVSEVWGGERVDLPVNTRNDLTDSNPQPLFMHLDRLNTLAIGYLHIIEGVITGPRDVEGGFDLGILRQRFHGLTMLNNCYTHEMALQAVSGGRADLIAFGRPFISNPDLVERLRVNAPLALPDPATFYGGDEKGYLGYPTLAA